MSLTKNQKDAIKAAIHAKGISKENKLYLAQIINLDLDNNKQVKLFVDGASDLHSGTGGIGGVIYKDDDEFYSFSKPLYEKSNNEAEYLALLKGINVLIELNIKNVNIFADSELVVKQVKGQYKVKNKRMIILHKEVLEKLDKLTNWTINHVLRENNKRADQLSKIGMEQAKNDKNKMLS